jgi:hypothetical protein
MARAMEVFMAVMILNAAIALVNAFGMFDENYAVAANSTAIDYQVDDLSSITSSTAEPTLMDYGVMTVGWLWEGFIFIIKFIAAFVFVYPVLVNELGVPAEISAFLQVMIYIVMIWFIVQWKSGRPWGGMK